VYKELIGEVKGQVKKEVSAEARDIIARLEKR